MPCRILLADSYPLFRAGIRALLEKQHEYEIVGEAGDGDSIIQLACLLSPDIVLLDMSMERSCSVHALEELSVHAPGSKVLMLSTHTDSGFVMKCLQLGAQGYLLKSASFLELELALQALQHGDQYLSSEVVPLVVSEAVKKSLAPSSPARPGNFSLTERQLEILRLIARGESTRSIALGLGLSVKTVEAHRSQVMHRLGIHDLASLVLFAVREGIIQVND
ncbi:response regulator transcription factor [Pseudomonas cichorii]|uniref:Response regulator transcription factor n=1 Tax=Pseudomonas lijiangensis TaxID=2995658 RepID=A0ABX8HN51_9PSED|nr:MULTISPECIES: response regulator transcription factor [Pseudomonas syringae group]MBX8490020.1 response regulator transcription factor [Pseudomonas cichorii]MBX8500012.1 response regulator transcription factor [Pseudomonas lijiangensis]MBX8503769.1 response regulator transcription factor [Pseudomonas lijiangensis]MBX8533498.1 response regulator transcription factor [Pseudomonas cichorii]MBX8538476.1 response regulator transcription factor [Pseudomonas cichorii]